MEETTGTAAASGFQYTPTTPATDGIASTATTVGDARAALALADATSTATPQTEATTPDPSQVAATAQPGAETTPAVEPSTEPKGEPPKWRWQDILDEQRKKSAAEAEARVRQEYDGLKDFATMSAEERHGLVIMHRAMAGDPAAQARVAQVQPQLAQSLGWVKAPAADPMPEPDLQAGDGSLVYSAKQQALKDEWLERKLESKWAKQFEEKLQPLQKTAQTFQEREAQAEFNVNSTKAIAKLASADPDFEKHKPDVGAVIQSDQQLMSLALNGHVDLALEIAWNRVRNSKVLPLKQQQAQAQVLTDLQQRAVAATTNPATASTATPKPTLGNARAALEHAYSVTGS
jgi:hypothetical protein